MHVDRGGRRGAGPGPGHGPHARLGVRVERDARLGVRVERDEVLDAALLARLAVGGTGERRVLRLGVAAHLDPEPALAVEAQQHVVEPRAEHETARREVLRTAVTPHRLGARPGVAADERAVLRRERLLTGIHGLPPVEAVEGVAGEQGGGVRSGHRGRLRAAPDGAPVARAGRCDNGVP